MTNRRKLPRRGYSLIEMVLIVGAVAIIIGLCASVLSGLFRIERSGRAALADSTTLARFARQFRSDARASKSARPSDPKTGDARLELTAADGRVVVYRVEQRRLIREERRGDRSLRTESYAAERLGPVSFGVEGRRVWAVLARKSSAAPALSRPATRVEAGLGKDEGIAALTRGKS